MTPKRKASAVFAAVLIAAVAFIPSAAKGQAADFSDCVPDRVRPGISPWTQTDVDNYHLYWRRMGERIGAPPSDDVVSRMLGSPPEVMSRFYQCVRRMYSLPASQFKDLTHRHKALSAAQDLAVGGARVVTFLATMPVAEPRTRLIINEAATYLARQSTAWILSERRQAVRNEIRELIRAQMKRGRTTAQIWSDANLFLGYDPDMQDILRAELISVIKEIEGSGSAAQQEANRKKFATQAGRPPDSRVFKQAEKEMRDVRAKVQATVSTQKELASRTTKALEPYLQAPDMDWSSVNWTQIRSAEKLSSSPLHMQQKALANIDAQLKDPKTRNNALSVLATQNLSENDFRAWKADVDTRVSFAEAQDLAQQYEAAFAGVGALAQVTNNPELARWAAAGTATAGAVVSLCKIFAVSGPVGPLGWASAMGTVVNLGLQLNNILGDAGGAISADAAIMKQLQQIMVVLEDIRHIALLILEDQRDNYRALGAQIAEVAILLNDQVFADARSCRQLVDAFPRGTLRTSAVIRDFINDPGQGRQSRAAACQRWLDVPLSTALTAEGIAGRFRLDIAVGGATADQAVKRMEDTRRYIRTAYIPLTELLLINADVDEWSESRERAALLLYPADTFHDLNRKLIKPQSSEDNFPVDLGGQLHVLSRTKLGDPPELYVSDLIASRVSSTTAHQTAKAALLLVPVMELLNENGAVETPDELTLKKAQDRSSQFRSALRNAIGLSLLAVATDSLESGDVLIPLIDALLEENDQPNLLEKCKNIPERNGKTLCERLGRSKFLLSVGYAQDAVREFAEVRTNVAHHRLRRHLAITDSPSAALHWAYSYAYGAENDVPLRTLVPNLDIRRLEQPAQRIPVDHYTDHGKWFTRLSGKCEGFKDLRLNTRGIFDNGEHLKQYAEIVTMEKSDYLRRASLKAVREKEGKGQVVSMEESEAFDRHRCVLAPLPAADVLMAGTLMHTYSRHIGTQLLGELVKDLNFLEDYLAAPPHGRFVLFADKANDAWKHH